MTDKLALHTRLEKDLTEDWQAILDILAEFMQVPVALILQADNQQVNVYARNQSKRNPFRLKQNLPSGSSLFHKKVIETNQQLSVLDASQSKEWAKSNELQYGLINYLGFPLHWPDSAKFGIICVMKTDAEAYTTKQKQVILQIKKIVESHLELVWQNQQLQAQSNNLQYLAYTDDLTESWNRRAFINESNKELKRSHRSGHIVCLLMMDIDDFKDINDAFGHEVGDEVLKLFSHCIQATKRPYDIFGRIGGEEFAILLPETGLKQATHLAERIRKKVSEIFYFTQGQSIKITVSIGVHQVDDKETNILVALNQADKLLYAAKHSGKNTVIATSL